MKKLSFLLPAFILLMLGFTFKAQSQYTCSTATQIAADTNNEYSFTSNYTEYWFSFIAVDSINEIQIVSSQSNPQANITSITLYDGDCGELNQIAQSGLADSLAISEILVYADTFYVKVIRTGNGTEYFGLNLIDNNSNSSSAIIPDCDNIDDGCFDEVTTTNPGLNPFINGLVPGWDNAWGSAQLYPQSPPYYAGMWVWDNYPPNYEQRGEGIYQNLQNQLTPGNKYKISLDYMTLGDLDAIWVLLTDNSWNPTPNPSNGSPLPIITGYQDCFAGNSINPSQPNNFAHKTNTFQLNSTYNYSRLLIFPEQIAGTPKYNNQGWLFVDCIELTPSETVTISPNPSLTIFKGTSVQLTAILSGNYTTGVSYVWSTSATSPSITVSPTVNTIYAVTVTYANNCIATDQVQVVVTDAGPDIYICSGTWGKIGQTAFSGYSYSWSPTGTLDNPLIAEPKAAPSTTTIYTVTVTSPNSSTATDDVVVYVTTSTFNNAVSVPQINSSNTSNNNCSGNKVTYQIVNPNQNYIYTWEITTGVGTFTYPIVAPNMPVMGTSVIIDWITIPVCGAVLKVTAIDKKNCYYNYLDYYFYNCCTGNNPDYSFLDEPISQYGTNFANKVIVINGTLYIDDNTNFQDCEVYLGPDGKIEVQSSFTLEIRGTSVVRDCDDANMWDGIYVNDNNSTIFIEGAEVLNAKNAVVSDNGGIFEIRDSRFEENYKGIVVKNYAGTHDGYVENTFFSTSQLLCPHSGKRGYAGIVCNNVEYLVIGDSTNSDYNTFSNMDYGIRSDNSYIRVVDNHFIDIGYQQAYTYPAPVAPVVAINSVKAGGSAKIYIGGDNTDYNKSNYFENCEMGIYARNNDFVVIVGNEFNFTSQDNGFHDAIKVVNLTPSSDPINIHSNNITGYRLGISTLNTLDIDIRCNEIEIKAPSTGQANDLAWGICTYASSGYIIENRNIVGPGVSGGNYQVRGISINSNSPSFIACNDIDDVDFGFHASGNNGICFIYTNDLYDCYAGFVLDGVTGFIGQQGYQYGPSDNKFWGSFSYADTWTINGADPTGYPIYVRNGLPFPYNPFFNPGNPGFTINQSLQGYTGYPCDPNECSNLISQYAFAGGGGPSLYNQLYISSSMTLDSLMATKTAEISKIIHDSVSFAAYNAENQWLGKYHIYDYILQNNNSLGNTFNSFLTTTGTSSIGQTTNVHHLIENGDITSAAILNNSIIPANNMDKGFKIFNNVYINKVADKNQIELDSADLADMVTLAWQCPYEYGTAVYSARELLSLLGDTNIYFNPCEFDMANNQYKSIIIEQNNEKHFVKVYPNPADHTIHFDISVTEEQSVRLLIVNTLGEVVWDQKTAETYNLKVNTKDLAPGLYFYKLYINNHLIETEKFIILH